jgi:hypothetical protein
MISSATPFAVAIDATVPVIPATADAKEARLAAETPMMTQLFAAKVAKPGAAHAAAAPPVAIAAAIDPTTIATVLAISRAASSGPMRTYQVSEVLLCMLIEEVMAAVKQD